MADIHKSKEVYRFTDTAHGDKLVPVRGLYVTGIHKEPWYIDHAITMVSETSNVGTIVSYTSRDESLRTDFILNVCDIDLFTVDVVNYYTRSDNVAADVILNVCGIDMFPVDAMAYTTASDNMETDVILNVCGVDMFDIDPPQRRSTVYADQQPQPSISLLSFTSSAGEFS